MPTRAVPVVRSVLVALLMTTLVAPAAQSIAASDRAYLIGLWRTRALVTSRARPRHDVGVSSPRDMVWGVVEQGEERGPTTTYEGLVRRATDEFGIAELVPRLGSERPCRGKMSGAGDVHVRIKVFPPADNRPAWIVITPVDVMAWATGNCPSSDLRALERAYGNRITLEIALPGGRLTPGRFDSERDAADGRWTLYVAAALADGAGGH